MKHLTAVEKPGVIQNSKHPADEPASKPVQSKKLKNVQTGICLDPDAAIKNVNLNLCLI